MMDFDQLPWWRTDHYDGEIAIPGGLSHDHLSGPKGLALVTLFNDGTTAKGWGKDDFMELYNKNRFGAGRALAGYHAGKHAFAYVMRSMKVVAIDIDGKNGGLEHAGKLGFLPPTLAETSKSGNGYHLFYEVEDEWDSEFGFAAYKDVIGLVDGVDIRGTGCIYHYNTQRWNNRPIAKMPEHLSKRLLERGQRKELTVSNIEKTLETEDDVDILMMHQQLLADLNKPIMEGKRNTTLFAIGSQMMQAKVPKWEHELRLRGIALGLEDEEIYKIIHNVEVYGE